MRVGFNALKAMQKGLNNEAIRIISKEQENHTLYFLVKLIAKLNIRPRGIGTLFKAMDW